MDCKGFKKKLGAYLEGQLSSDAQKTCEQHLEECEVCRTFKEEFIKLWSMVDKMERVEPSPYFKTRVKSRLKAIQIMEQVKPVWLEFIFNRMKPAITVAIVLVGIFMGYSIGSHLYTQKNYQISNLNRTEEINQFVSSHYLNMLNQLPSSQMMSISGYLNINQ